MINKKIISIICVLFILLVGISIVSANDNITEDTYQNDNSQENYKQNTEYDESDINTKNITTSKSYSQNITKKNDTKVKTATTDNYDSLTLNVSVTNKTVKLVSDAGSEVAISKNITTVNGKPDVTKLGTDYAYVDENGTYTIEGSEIRRVMRLDSLCQQIYGFVPKYTFFRAIGSNVKYVISREKWNVIARSLNGYHVNKGYNAVNTPYSVTVNLTGKSRYYNVYYDAQEWINGHQYTCGPTAMSMISQALNCYASEKRLAGLYSTTASEGTGESSIIRNSPTAHMKLTDITDSKTSVKNALITGKMVFWHIRGHYMCIIGYNSVTDRFLCLNPSGPSHNINAVQWATWSQVMNTDRGLKEKGFMSVKPYWDLTSSNKTHAKYYYYNMGGKYTVPSNNEYCNGGYDNKVKVIADAPSNIPKTTNQTVLKINSKVTGTNAGEIRLYIDTKGIKSANVQNGIVSVNYTLPAYTPDNIIVTSKYVNSSGDTVVKVKVALDKNVLGKYSNTSKFKSFEQLTVDDVVAKKGDIVTFTAHIKELNGNVVNNGKVVFKLNGNTLKRNGSPIKVNVVKGVAKLKFTIPSYSAKKYKLTAVFGNNTHRFEDEATLTINKLDTKISNLKFSQKDNKGIITAKILDENDDIVERDTKISIKIDGKTIVNQVKIQNGLLNMTLDLSKYATGKHTIIVIAGENGLYKTSRINKTVTITQEATQSKISISNLDLTVTDDVVKVLAEITTSDGVNIVDDVKLSMKVDGKTVVNKAVVSNGKVNKSIDVSRFDRGVHDFSMIVGETRLYESCVLNTTFSIS